jgi:hypothetical protein
MTKYTVPLTNVIAERILSVNNADHLVRVSVFAPLLGEDGKAWGCPFRIEFKKEVITEFVWGVDSLQTLQLASGGIKMIIKENFSTIEFTEDLEDLFPDFIPHYMGAEFREHIKVIIEVELDKKIKKLKEKHQGGINCTEDE